MPDKKCVLIADDDRQLVQALSSRCKRIGLDVIEAFTGLEAMRAVIEEHPDLMCIDVNIPAGDGLTVCEVLAKDEAASKIPVIVLTGRRDAGTKRRCSELSAYYLQKSPDIWSRIEPVIEELVDIRVQSSEFV